MNTATFKKHLDLLGMKVTDKVTGFNGVVDSVGFDLYGCIQAAVNPGLDKDGKRKDGHWFDVSRLSIDDPTPVMSRPLFEFTPAEVAAGGQGAAEKPAITRS